MAKSFGLVFWGLLLVFADVRAGIELLPDVAGYVMIATGAGRLAGAAPGFAAARLVAWAMVLPGVVDFVRPLQSDPLLGLVETLGQVALTWTLLTGIAALTAEGDWSDLARPARRIRNASVAVAAAGLVLRLLAAADGADVGAIGVVLALVNLVLLALMLHLVHRVRGELAPGAAVPHVPRPAAYPPRG